MTLVSWPDRRHKVKIGDTVSTTQTINTGCPQGSILGPLLAILYLDGLADQTENVALFYADDISLYTSHSFENRALVQASMQRDLNIIENYGKQWAITFNSTKTVCQTFSYRNQITPLTLTFAGQSIPSVDSHKHLGLILSKDLRFHDHVKK